MRHQNRYWLRLTLPSRPIIGGSRCDAGFHRERLLDPVDLDLGEVGVAGQVEGQAGRDGVLQVHTDVTHGCRRHSLVAATEVAGNRRDDLEAALRRGRHPDASQLTGQRESEQMV